MPQLINNIDSFFKEFPQTLFKRMGLITIGLDTKGDIQYANPYLLKITGYTRKEVIKKNWFSLFIPEDKQENISNVQAEVLEKDLRPHYINDILTKDGRTLTISWNNTVIKNLKGDSIGTFSIGVNITKREKAEAELQHQLKELTALHGVATAGSRAKSVDELIELTTQILGDTLYSDNFGLVLMNQDGKTMTPHPSYRGIPAESMKIEQSIETGICGRAVRIGKPQRVSDTSKDKNYLMLKANTRSELTVPLWVNEKIFGVINAESTQINAFSEKDEQLLITFANQLTIAIEKLHLLESTQRQTREITALYDTALATSNILDTQELIHQLYEQIKNLFPLDTFLLTTYDRQAEEITITYIIEEGQELQDWINQKFTIKESGLNGWVTRNQKSLLVRDMQVEKLPAKPKHSANPARSWLGVPLTARGSTIGAISVQSFAPNVFDQNHQRLLESIASQVAVTLENSRLVEQTRTSLEQISALHDIDLVINSSLDLRVTLNIVLNQVIEKLGVDASAVLLLNPRSKMLEYAAGRGFITRLIENYKLRLGEGLSGQAAMGHHLMQALNLSELEDNMAYLPLMQEEGFISFYSVPLITKGQVRGVLDVFNRSPFNPGGDWINFLETLAGQAAIAIDNTTLLEDLQRSNIELTLAYDTTLEGWVRALDLRDHETEGHTLRVVDMTVHMAQILSIPDDELAYVRRGALLHDIGKMGISDTILLKPGPLTKEEWVNIHKHPTYAYKLLHPIKHLLPAIDIPYCHHEKWDGSGYPRGLKGEEIPLPARIFTVVDVWDALTSDRPYRKAWSAKKALKYIQEQSGKHFDPQVVELFLKLIKNELIKR